MSLFRRRGVVSAGSAAEPEPVPSSAGYFQTDQHVNPPDLAQTDQAGYFQTDQDVTA